MNKKSSKSRELKLFATAIFGICSIFSYAQAKTEAYQISLPVSRISGSFYNNIHLMDIRDDSVSLGIVQKGAFNKRATVVAETPLATQFSNVLNALADNTAKEGELLLLLRQLSFAEITKAMSELGYCHFRAVLFAKVGEGYSKLETIDTVVVIKAMDVTKKMFRLGSEAVTDFISRNLTKEPSGDIVLSLEQLPQIDSFEKTKIPLYTTVTYTDGLYYTYQSFASQQPDETGVSIVFDKKGRVQKINYINKKGQKWDIENRFIYAFVYEGKLYISGEFTCYPLEKRGDDFYFTGKANDAKSGDIMAAQFFFGIMGSLMASSATSIFEMKIDHITGGFIRVKEVEK
jgi:hypothetical protein